MEREPLGGVHFSRRATGLVREASLTDAFIFNWAAGGGVGLAVAWGLTWAIVAYPGVNFFAAMGWTVPFALAAVLVFALFAAAMPRSGGDYVFVSRTLHPSWGFVSSWTGFVSVASYNALVVWWVATVGLSPALSILGYLTGNESLVKASGTVVSTTGSLVVGTVTLVLVGVIMAAGIRRTLQVLNIAFAIGMVGLLLSVIVLAGSGHAEFVAQFNAFAQPITQSADSYGDMIRLAAENGYGMPGSAPSPFLALPIMFYVFGYSVWTAYMGGEIKGAGRLGRQIGTMIGPTILNMLLLGVVFALLFRVVGYEFLGASNYLYNYVPDAYPLPVPPYASLFASLVSGSGVLNFLISVTWIAWPVPMILLVLVQFTRTLLAWSFDGVLPYGLSEVNERTHSPVRAIITVCAATWLALLAFLYYTSALFTFLAIGLLLALVMWLSVAVAAALFPYRRPEMYRSSPAKWEVAGMPVISLAGTVLALFVVYEFYLAFSQPALGIVNVGQAVLVTAVTMGVGIAIFAVSWLSRKQRGINPANVYQEIPPE